MIQVAEMIQVLIPWVRRALWQFVPASLNTVVLVKMKTYSKVLKSMGSGPWLYLWITLFLALWCVGCVFLIRKASTLTTVPVP